VTWTGTKRKMKTEGEKRRKDLGTEEADHGIKVKNKGEGKEKDVVLWDLTIIGREKDYGDHR